MIRGGINALKFFFLMLLLLGCAVVIYLSTDMGKAHLIQVALGHVNKQEFQIEISEIESYFPLKIKFSYIEVLDKGEPLIYLRDATLSADASTLFFDKKLMGRLDIEEFILFDTPPDQSEVFVPLQLGIGLDLDVYCGASLIEGRGPNYFMLVSLKEGKIQYNSQKDDLNYTGKLSLNMSGQPLCVDVSGHGQLNDFDLVYSVHGDQYNFQDVIISEVQGAGTIQHFPWKGEGLIDVGFRHGDVAGRFNARLMQNRYIFQLDELSLMAKDFSLKGELTYNSHTINIKGSLVAELNNSQTGGAIPITGLLKASSQFELQGDKLNIKLDATGRNLKSQEGAIQAIECHIDAEDVLKSPAGSVKFNASEIDGSLGVFKSISCDSNFKNGLGEVALTVKGDRTAGDVALGVNYQTTIKLFNVKALDIKVDNIPIKLASPFQISLKEQTITISPANLVIMNSPLLIQGDMKNGNLDFKATGHLDMLTVTRLYLKDSDVVTGKMKIDMRVTGPLDKIRLEGGAEINGGFYENISTGTLFKDIHIKLEAGKDAISIVEAYGSDGQKGRATVTGSYHFMNQMIDIRLKGEQVSICNTDRLSLVARDADVTLKGTPSQAVVAGLITVEEGSFSIASQVKSSRETLNVINPVKRKKLDLLLESTGTGGGLEFNPGLDLTLKLPPVLKINGRGLTSTWKGKLELKGTVDDPAISGHLDVVAGHIDFLGQTVELKKGIIKFDGSADNIPYIDTTGSLQKQDIMVTVGIVGRVNKPAIDLQSKPSMPKDEILSILFFGKDKSTLSPLEGVQLARSLAAYKGIGPDLDFFGLLTDNLGLDQFTIGSGSTEGTYMVKLSKRLGDKIRVNLNQGMKPADSSVELEVDVTKNISVKGEHGFSGSSDGVSVNYNWDY
jgi:autotransporter translocation and assembly factor TamB